MNSEDKSVFDGYACTILRFATFEIGKIFDITAGKIKKHFIGIPYQIDLLRELLTFYSFCTYEIFNVIMSLSFQHKACLMREIKGSLQKYSCNYPFPNSILSILRAPAYDENVSGYLMRGEMSPVNDEEKSRWAKTLQWDSFNLDYINQMTLVSFLRILSAIDHNRAGKFALDKDALSIWIIHSNQAIGYKKFLIDSKDILPNNLFSKFD